MGKKKTNPFQPREEAKEITQCIKASAFKEINKICDTQFRPKCFDSTLECIKHVRTFLIAHFGPPSDPNFLETKVEKLTAQNCQLRSDLEIGLHLLKSMMESEEVSSRACLLRGGHRVSRKLGEVLANKGIMYQKYVKCVVDFAELLKFVPSDESVKGYDL